MLTETELTKDEIVKVNHAFDHVGESWLECCVLIASLEMKQKAIAELRNFSKQAISKMVTVGKNADKMYRIKILPNSWTSLYELSSLTEDEINNICVDGIPTQKKIKEEKEKLGKIKPRKKSSKKKEFKMEELEEMAMMVPPKSLSGLSDFGIKSLGQDLNKIKPIFERTTKAMGRETITLFVDLLKYQQSVFNNLLSAEVKKQVPKEIEQREKELDEREKKVSLRERSLIRKLPDEDMKIIQSCLHPDKLPNGVDPDRYAKAFAAFRKWAS